MGKSTVVVNLAVLLGQGGRRTLVCDRDPQGNAADCVDPLRVVGAVERSGAVVVSIPPRCPAADGQPPHLLSVEGDMDVLDYSSQVVCSGVGARR